MEACEIFIAVFLSPSQSNNVKNYYIATDSSLNLKKNTVSNSVRNVYDFYYLDNGEDSIAAVTHVCNTQQLLKHPHSITSSYFGVLFEPIFGPT